MIICKNKKRIIFALMLIVIMTMAIRIPSLADETDEEEKKVVRVGWYESSYNSVDENGFRSGYAYEYQLKLSSYNGWSYEYVEGSWSDLLEMLEKGEIDLMSDVSYTPERAEHMLYSSLPMGAEEYYLFTTPQNEEILSIDPHSLDGKKLGVNKDSYQSQLFKQWVENNNISADIVYLTCTEDESLKKMEKGELDAYVTVDSFLEPEKAVPVFKIGSSDYYFAVSKERPDLLEDLNYAMGRIQDENRYYNQQMFEKYIKKAGANTFLSDDEVKWLKEHKSIRVGYQDDYMAFCAKDEETGELTGVLKDFLYLATDCIPNAHIDFEAVAYPSAADAIEALKTGQVDCVFPANLSGYEAEQQGMVITPPLMDTEMYAVVSSSDPNIFMQTDAIKVAVNEGNPNYDSFLAKHYPTWEKVYFKDTDACLEAIYKGKADCLIISNFRYNNIERICHKYRLTTFSLSIQMDYSFALRKGDTEIYSIMAKTIGQVPASSIDAALSYYITKDAKMTFTDFLVDNFWLIMLIVLAVILSILILLFLNIHQVKKAERLISATESDDLTGLYNRKYFFQYAYRLFHDHPEKNMDAIVLNIEQFHSINAMHGRDIGDKILQELGKEIIAMTIEDDAIAGRFEADRFDIYCPHRDEYKSILERLQKKMDETIPSIAVRLRMGVMPWRDKVEPVQMFDQAGTACNMARGKFTKRLVIYDDSVSERERYDLRLVNDLKKSIDADEFEIYFQPKYYVQTDPPKFMSAEALVRWNHPILGKVPTGDFIPLFEKNGQINLLDKYVWKKTAEFISRWNEKYGVIVPVSVNLSRVDVFDPKLEETLDGILESNKLSHEAFKLEITESAYTENAEQVIEVVDSLRKKGYKVEMDDFGSGYSSLNMLSSMPIDVLKMDMVFVRNIDRDEKDKQLVELIIDIAKNLKVPVIAEGVERESQLNLLKSMGCDIVQGYYFFRPLPADEFEKRVLEQVINDLK